jgi:hypothetical protein
MHCFYLITFRYRLRFEISDHTTSTTCTIFDDEAKRILKITVSEILDLLQGNDSEVPKIIQELYGKSFIFRFKLNERNLTEGGQGYLVTMTFILDDVLEQKFKNDQNNKVRDIFVMFIFFSMFFGILIYYLNMVYLMTLEKKIMIVSHLIIRMK